MNIGFWDNQLCERGTTDSLYNYAYYNESILGNKSYIFYDKTNTNNVDAIIKKFEARFVTHGINNFIEVDTYLKQHNITHIYIIKYGLIDTRISKFAKNCIHCVFNCTQPHGDIYACISKSVKGYNDLYPVVPHMINVREHNEDMRQQLNIPKDAIVFGGYGGRECFNINFVHTVISDIVNKKNNIYFLFANFKSFCNKHKNIIHLPMITDPYKKTAFINTCDAMLWARNDGETFGIAIGEFSTRNKPIIAMKIGDINHAEILKDNAYWYNNKESLSNILINFNKNVKKDWNMYKQYTPENVMKIFKEVFLD